MRVAGGLLWLFLFCHFPTGQGPYWVELYSGLQCTINLLYIMLASLPTAVAHLG